MSILGLDSGYTVKYNPLPSGVPSGRQRVIFDHIFLVSSKYGNNEVHMLERQWCRILLYDENKDILKP